MSITENRESTLAAVADALIPRGHDGPSASDVGIVKLVTGVLASRPDLESEFLALLDTVDGNDPEAWARALLSDRPGDFALLTDVVVAAWLTAPQARSWLGWRRIGGEFEEPDPVAEIEIDTLLAPVRERGASYRPTGWRPARGGEQ